MQLSDTQLVILTAACQRNDWHVLPLPANLKGGAASKVVASLLGKNLIEEVDAMRGDPIWRETSDGHGTTLVLTEHAFAALGIAPEESPEPDASRSATGAGTGASGETSDNDATSSDIAPAVAKSRTPRDGTKQATLIAMLRAPDGATIAEIVAATGWHAHRAWCYGGCAQKEARAHRHQREGRRARAGLPVARSLTPQLSSCHGRRPDGAAVASLALRIRMASNTRRNVKLRAIDTTVYAERRIMRSYDGFVAASV